MIFQVKHKELLGSIKVTMDADLLASIEAMALYGNATRSDTREQFVHEADWTTAHWLTVSVYRPGELVSGTPCLVRTLKKSRRGAWLYKIVIAPNAYKMTEEPLEEVAPADFWGRAYWEHVSHACTVSEDA